jgi:hypothetical protein
MSVISNPPYPSYFDVDGSPLENGYLYFGAANQNPETNPITVYWDSAYLVPAAQPIRTSGGFAVRNGSPANVYVTTDYSLTVRDKNRRLVYSKLLSEGQTTAEVNIQFSTQTVIATSGQTVFNLSTAYTPGNQSLAVYHNGARLVVAQDYTETSATVVTLLIGATVGDVLQFVTATPINPSSLGAAAVAYVPAGAGAVATDVQTVLRETVSVTRFGADPTGVTDSTSAINAAIQYAKTSAIKCVEVPSGNYRTTSSIIIGGNFGAGIEFVGKQATITCSGNVPIIDINCRVPDTPPQVRMNCYVHGFTLVGPGKANTSSAGVKASRGAGVKVENCSITAVYRGVWGFGNLISHYSDLNIYSTFMPLQFEPDGIEFAANDIHFTRLKVFDNDRVCRMINFPNGAMTFIGCELEGNNLSGGLADGVRVAEFFDAGKVTMIGCHMEENPGQYNLFFDGNNNSHLSVNGCEIIPGDSCANVLYMANATGSPSLFVSGSRVTNNVVGGRIVLSTGAKGYFIGTQAGQVTGDVSKVVFQTAGILGVGRDGSVVDGNGIAFPATQVPSTNANTLDDYAEGTFTPTIIGLTTAGTATYANQNARYTKIGRQVFVEMFINWSAGSGTGDFAISGLPFTVSNTPVTYPAANISRTNAFAWTAGNVLSANFEPGTNRILFYQVPVGGGTVTPVAYDAAGYVMVSGTYTV